jgi:hypothetical protein
MDPLQVPLPQKRKSIGKRLRLLYWKLTKRASVTNNAPCEEPPNNIAACLVPCELYL